MSTPIPGTPLGEADSNQWSFFAHLSGIISSFIGPLIIWQLFKDRSTTVDDQAKEALNFQLTVLIGYFASTILMSIGIGFLLYLGLWVASVILSILAGLAAQKGELYRYPVVLRLIK